jgi:hypothetical protein
VATHSPDDIRLVSLIHICNSFNVTCVAYMLMHNVDPTYEPHGICSCPYYVCEEGTCVNPLYLRGYGSNIRT